MLSKIEEVHFIHPVVAGGRTVTTLWNTKLANGANLYLSQVAPYEVVVKLISDGSVKTLIPYHNVKSISLQDGSGSVAAKIAPTQQAETKTTKKK